MSTRLILARHGQTTWNASRRFQGQTDVPLDETGLAQAAALGRKLASDLANTPTLRAIYTTDLQRAHQTAQIIAQALLKTAHQAPPLVIEPRLREMHFGDWQGMTYAEISRSTPQALAQWEADLARFSPPNGETMGQFAARVGEALDAIRVAHQDGAALVVAHGGPLQLMVCLALGLPADRFWQFQLSNASLSELNFYPAGAILNLFNDTSHLQAGKLDALDLSRELEEGRKVI
jgi:probable phosphoglycerate mutase